MERLFRILGGRSFFDKLVVLLGACTFAAIVGEDRLLSLRFEITPETQYQTTLSTDTEVGGRSEARWRDKAAFRWDCDIKPGFEFPFCVFQIQVAGIDLSEYEEMNVWLDYRGSASTVRVFLRNFNPAYSRPGDVDTLKYNRVELRTAEPIYPATIAMSDFQVADWWLLEHNVPLQHSRPEMDNVVIVEIQTGTGAAEGQHEFGIDRIVWTGKRLSTERWYLIWLVAWLALIVGRAGYNLWGMRKELERKHTRERELLELNRAIGIEAKEFESQAKTDALTGVYNRAGVRDDMHRGAELAVTQKRPLSLVLVDIDNFKVVNDMHGHEAGDEILRTLARVLMERVRSTDKVARWGGDEFLLVCPDTELQDAASLARSLRSLVEETVNIAGKPVTASFGVATMRVVGGESITQVIERADGALYEAKESGRNSVFLSPTPGV